MSSDHLTSAECGLSSVSSDHLTSVISVPCVRAGATSIKLTIELVCLWEMDCMASEVDIFSVMLKAYGMSVRSNQDRTSVSFLGRGNSRVADHL